MAKTTIEVDLVIKGSDSVSQVEQKTKSLKGQLREMKELLASGTLDAGKFAELSAKAGKLQDQIGDVNQQVKNLSSDARKLDAFVSVTQGIVGGFAAVQGITALVGDENEDLQKTMVKLQGAMAALNGLQAVAATLNKSSAASTTLMTFAQARYTAVVGTTTGALKLLRIAGATLGIGLIVAAIALLIANFDKLKNVVTKFLPSLETLGNLFTTAKNAVTDFLGITNETTRAVDKFAIANEKKNKTLENEIEVLQALGGKEEEIYRKKSLMISNNILLLERKKLAGLVSEEKYQEGIETYRQEERVLEAQHHKQLEDARKKSADKKVKIKQDEVEKIKETDQDAQVDAYKRWKEQNDLEQEQLFAELERQVEYDATVDELNKKNAAAELQAEKDKEDAKLSILNSYGAAAMSVGEALIGAEFKQTAAGKIIALSQIATDTALAISALVKNSQANPANAPTSGLAGAVQFAAGIAQITANIANARRILVGGGTPSAAGGGGSSVGNSQPPPIQGFIPQQRQDVKGSQRVYVLEKDITDTQGRVARIRTNATLM